MYLCLLVTATYLSIVNDSSDFSLFSLSGGKDRPAMGLVWSMWLWEELKNVDHGTSSATVHLCPEQCTAYDTGCSLESRNRITTLRTTSSQQVSIDKL